MTTEGLIYVIFVSLLIFGIGAVFIGVFLVLLASANLVAFNIIAPIYVIILILLVVSYYRAVCGSPGYVSPIYNNIYTQEEVDQYKRNEEKHRFHKQQRRQRAHPQPNSRDELDDMLQFSYCTKCEAVKLPRSHHCKQCQHCIIRMDHHCPWIGNCVGRHNHKFFMLFLLYATVGLTITWVSILIDAFNEWGVLQYRTDPEEMTTVYLGSVAAVMAFFLSLAIGSLFIAQLYGLWQNLTTLQSWTPGAQTELPFQRGPWKEDFSDIMGKDSLWLLPTTPVLSPDYRSQAQTENK